MSILILLYSGASGYSAMFREMVWDKKCFSGFYLRNQSYSGTLVSQAEV